MLCSSTRNPQPCTSSLTAAICQSHKYSTHFVFFSLWDQVTQLQSSSCIKQSVLSSFQPQHVPFPMTTLLAIYFAFSFEVQHPFLKFSLWGPILSFECHSIPIKSLSLGANLNCFFFHQLKLPFSGAWHSNEINHSAAMVLLPPKNS